MNWTLVCMVYNVKLFDCLCASIAHSTVVGSNDRYMVQMWELARSSTCMVCAGDLRWCTSWASKHQRKLAQWFGFEGHLHAHFVIIVSLGIICIIPSAWSSIREYLLYANHDLSSGSDIRPSEPHGSLASYKKAYHISAPRLWRWNPGSVSGMQSDRGFRITWKVDGSRRGVFRSSSWGRVRLNPWSSPRQEEKKIMLLCF